MSAHASKGQGHAGDGAVRAHVSSSVLYAGVLGALLLLTLATVAQSYLELGRLNVILVVVIAAIKASLVAAFFMHLRRDNKLNALLFICCLLFVGVFFALTMSDTALRGDLDADQNVKVWQRTGEEAPGGLVPAGEPRGEAKPAGH